MVKEKKKEPTIYRERTHTYDDKTKKKKQEKLQVEVILPRNYCVRDASN